MATTRKSGEPLFSIFPWRGPEQAVHAVRTGGGMFMALHLPWEEQARKNHNGQSLSQLNGRGGVHAAAAVAILEDRPETDMSVVEANMRLVELWIAFEKSRNAL